RIGLPNHHSRDREKRDGFDFGMLRDPHRQGRPARTDHETEKDVSQEPTQLITESPVCSRVDRDGPAHSPAVTARKKSDSERASVKTELSKARQDALPFLRGFRTDLFLLLRIPPCESVPERRLFRDRARPSKKRESWVVLRSVPA